MSKQILVVEDEEPIARLISYNLTKEGYNVTAVADGLDALRKIRSADLDLIILDIMLPGMDGYDICRTIRKENILIPIILLSAKDEELDKILGLELGGDDYITKPFSPRELVARVRALLRRSQVNREAPEDEVLLIDRIKIDLTRHEVKLDQSVIQLTPKEFELLVYLIRHRGKVLSRDLLLDKVWDYDFAGDTRIVDVHISRLREKIETDPKNPGYIQTVRGVGYRFREQES